MAVLAVDWGASSIRVGRVSCADDGRIDLDVVHRYEHRPVVASDGTLHWDWTRLVAETNHGLEAGVAAGPVESIGVDTWAVDYGLLDGAGWLVSAPFSYRDRRTDRWREIADRIGVDELYGITGLQLMPINTVFQLAVHDRAELDRAARLLMLPDLLVHELCGAAVTERTVAGTSGLYDIAAGDWSESLCAAIGVDPGLFAPIADAGTTVGTWRGIPVHLVGSHDTASAVIGGAAPGSVFVSAGTWLLVGAERRDPDFSEAARAANFSNELGAFAGVRLLRNVAGGWLLDECRREWGDAPLATLVAEAATVTRPVPTFDATDLVFVAPASMVTAICEAAGLPAGAPRAVVVRCAIESMAATVAGLADELAAGGPEPPNGISVFGGGAQFTLLTEALARHCRLPVTIGPTEATLLGNALAQFVAIGRFDTIGEARAALAAAR